MNDKTKEAMERLEAGLETLLDNEEWKRYLQFQATFHRYSFGNTLLILFQCPNASYVAGFKKWKEVGRFVRKGQQGIAILAPLIGKKKSDEAEADVDVLDQRSKETKKVLYGFRVAFVFDVSQTDGEPLPNPDTPMIMEGESGLYERLRQTCTFPVREVDKREDGSLGAFYHRTKHIEILSTLPEATKAKVLAHEWAHGLLHGLDTVRPTRDTRELEAESTAFVVCKALGLDTGEYSFSYIAEWSGKEAIETLKLCGQRIQKAANTILAALEPQTTLKEAV